MPHPFHPDDFPINQQVALNPTQVFYLKGCIHFKTDARVLDLSGHVKQPWNNFSHAFMDDADAVAQKLDARPSYQLSSCGNMMRTSKPNPGSYST